MYKSPSSVEIFTSHAQANKTTVLAAVAAVTGIALAGSMAADDLNYVVGSLAMAYAGIPALALAQNASKLKSNFSKKFFPEKFIKQQHNIRAKVDDMLVGNYKESILATASDARNMDMISESNLRGIIRISGEDSADAISALDRLTEYYKAPVSDSKTEVEKTVNRENENYESYRADELDQKSP
jgi:hypothetical protein